MSEDRITVFELRGVYVFRYGGDRRLPTRVESAYNDSAGRYELPDRSLLDSLPEDLAVTVVEDDDEFRVEFPAGSLPDAVAEEAVFVDEGPMTETALLSTEAAVERAVEAGGSRVAVPGDGGSEGEREDNEGETSEE